MSRPTAHADVYHAMADPTRRAIMDRLRRGGSPVSELAAGFRMSRPAVSKHLGVLRRARLVRERRDGRRRIYQITPAPLEAVAQWVESYRAFWHANLLSLKRHVEGDQS
jgi:DNA-binding transcriptional ArsR family regulator